MSNDIQKSRPCLTSANLLVDAARALCSAARYSTVNTVKIHTALDNARRAILGDPDPIFNWVVSTSSRQMLEAVDALRQEVFGLDANPSRKGFVRAWALEFAGVMYRAAGEILQGEFGCGTTLDDEDI